MKDDYSDVIFSTGIMCFNTNNKAYCIVIDGNRGNEKDRSSLVLEFHENGEFLLHSPPNRALKPTGRIGNLKYLKEALDKYI